jgi:hypothetical protein
MDRSLRGRLSLKTVQARHTSGIEMLGKMDPYVVVEHSTFNAKSRTHGSAGKFPTWNSDFVFPTSLMRLSQ